jgi:hypothetical protein
MCVQVTKTPNRFEISSLLEKILLKQVRWCLTFVGLYNIYTCKLLDIFNMEERTFTVMLLAIVTPLRQSIIA